MDRDGVPGHGEIATTAEVCQHVAEESKREAVNRVADALWDSQRSAVAVNAAVNGGRLPSK